MGGTHVARKEQRPRRVLRRGERRIRITIGSGQDPH